MHGQKVKRAHSLRVWGQSQLEHHDRLLHLQVQNVLRGVISLCEAASAAHQAQRGVQRAAEEVLNDQEQEVIQQTESRGEK